ncbi:MAG: LptF/LptG family permease [Caldimicrobium sp.]|nr:LptF/LptG family permease [Caldimicrobium sp.]
MNLLNRFLFREACKTFLLLLLFFLVFNVVIDFFEKLPSFLTYKKPFFYFLTYLFWKIQLNLFQIYPYAIGLSVLVSLILLSRTYELLGLISLGIQPKEIFKKLAHFLLIFTLGGTLALILLSPKAYFEAQKTWDILIEEKKAHHLIFKGEFFFEGENFFLIAKPLEPKGEFLADLTLIYIYENRPTKILWAEYALYQGKTWLLEKVVQQDIKEDFKPRFSENWSGELPFKPKTFVLVEKPIRYLSLKELYQRWLFLKRTNKPQKEVLTEFLNRLFYLFSGYILGLYPLYLYLKSYAPHQFQSTIIKSFVSFFILTFLYLFLQTISSPYPYFSLFIFLALLMANFRLHLKRAF